MLGAALKANSQAKKWLRRTKSKDGGLKSPTDPAGGGSFSSSSSSEEEEEEVVKDDGFDMASLQRMLTMNEEALKGAKKDQSLLLGTLLTPTPTAL
jgi:hypothetical protein